MGAETVRLDRLADGVAVVMGVKRRNLATRHRDNPRIVIWDETRLGRELPVNARAVLAGRWIPHKAWTPIADKARARQVPMYAQLTTGRLRQALDTLSNSPSR